MSLQSVPAPSAPELALVPESAPFSSVQRSWLNGFFAGLLAAETAQDALAPAPGAAEAPAAEEAPWRDAAMPLAERMTLAEGRPLELRLNAAMAQQDCGQCGYRCETYARALAGKHEERLNLCAPGGKETSRMLKRLLEEAGGGGAAETASAPVVFPGRQAGASKPGYSRAAPVEAVFLGARRLTGEGSEKDVRHVELDLSASGVTYAPGDSLGLFPRNDPALADAVLSALDAPADFPVGGNFPVGGKTLRQALIEDYALGAAPDVLFDLISCVIGGERRQKARRLAKGEDVDGDADMLDVLGALRKFAPLHPDPEAFVESLEPLQPRLYSISSAPEATPGRVSLTVDAVRYELGGRRRLGVASTYLADRLRPGDPVQVFIQKAHGFALPADPAAPVIMVGPGTGVAPFRSFLWSRRTAGATGRNWLFFGHQREATDFLYRDELEALAAEGVLTRLSTAWSRDGAAKAYVQHRMAEAGAELWAWLSDGAHFYVCGDAKRMARDVEAELAAIARRHGGLGEADARAFIAKLKAEGRYQADVY